MKNYIFSLAFLLFMGYNLSAQALSEGVYAFANDEAKHVLILVDGYASLTVYQKDLYISTTGGIYNWFDNQFILSVDYNDANPDEVNDRRVYDFVPVDTGFKDREGNLWIKQEEIKSELDGAWTFKSRYSDGVYRESTHVGSRRTVKLLKDGHFQWIAIHSDEKEIYGTGGGVYTFKDGIYSEHILFFSRDNSRVGATLNFDGEVKEGDWHHSGFSSKGDPLHEVWTRGEM